MKQKHPLLAVFAADHRDSFARLFGEHEDVEQLMYYKTILARAYLSATGDCGATGVFLTDTRYGFEALNIVAEKGEAVAVPLEQSGSPVFTLEEENNLALAREIAPDYVKCLIRLAHVDAKVQLDSALADLKKAYAFAQKYMTQMIVEIVPRGAVDGVTSPEVLALDLVFAMDYLWKSGIRPDYWKLPGSASEAYYTGLARYFLSSTDRAYVLILGGDQPLDMVLTSLKLAKKQSYFAGFAVGRTLWKDELMALHQGKITPEEATFRIGAHFHACCREITAH